MGSTSRRRETRVVLTETFEKRFAALSEEDQRTVWRAMGWIRANPRPNGMTRRRAPERYGAKTVFYAYDRFVFTAVVTVRKRKVRGGRLEVTTVAILAMRTSRRRR